MTLDLRPRIADADGFFALLAEMHHGLSDAESRRLDARLVLILANHIGDMEVLRSAIALAKADAPSEREGIRMPGR